MAPKSNASYMGIAAAEKDVQEGRTLQVVTAVGAPLVMSGAGWVERLAPLDTLVVPASAGAWELQPGPGGRALVAALP